MDSHDNLSQPLSGDRHVGEEEGPRGSWGWVSAGPGWAGASVPGGDSPSARSGHMGREGCEALREFELC